MIEWISVGDGHPELPAKGRRRAYVLVHMPITVDASHTKGSIFAYWNGHEFRYGDETRVRHKVSHWMPIPNPPTK